MMSSPALVILIVTASWPRPVGDRFRPGAQVTSAIRAIFTAQTQYYSQFNRYATSLRELGPPDAGPSNAGAAGLIGAALASGTLGGYRFALTGTADTYAITASPVAFGASGVKSFYLNQDGILRASEGQEPATSASPEFAK